MLKKMWAIFDKNKLISGAFSYMPRTTKEVKPVWVTDEDPFANVRKLVDTEGDYTLEEMNDAALKDIENFDREV